MPLTTPDLEPAVRRLERPEKDRASATSASADSIIQKAPEMAILRDLGAGLLRITGNLASDTARVKAALAETGDLQDRTLLLINNTMLSNEHPLQGCDEAIDRFGVDCVRSQALAAAMSEWVFSDGVPSRVRTRVWRHLIWVALCSRLIARRCGLPHPDLVFTAGLLHDIGYLFEERYATEAFDLVAQAAGGSRPTPDLEVEMLGFDHGELGARIAQACGFPAVVESAAAFHHRCCGCQDEDRFVIRCVQAGDFICSLRGLWSIAPAAQTFPSATIVDLGFGKGDIRNLVRELEQQAVGFETVLNRPACRGTPSWARSPATGELAQK